MSRRRGRPLLKGRVPSADTVGYAYARSEPDGIRKVLVEMQKLALRKKVLRHRGRHTPWTVMIDAHEVSPSFCRTCPECLERKVGKEGEERVQYYHRHVMAQLVDAEPPMCLDAELIRPGEGETVAARRLIARVMRNFPFVRVFTMDAIYLEAPVLRLIAKAGRGAIVVLKQEARDLYQDARALMRMEPARKESVDGEEIAYWDIRGFKGWSGLEGIDIRVVRTILRRKVRHRIAKKWVETEEEQDWTWATVGIGPEVGALTIHRLGHARWDGENCGFNEQDRYFGLDHIYHHDPKAILNFILTLFLATFLTEVFFTRNLKNPRWLGMTLLGLCRLLLENPPMPGEPSIWASGP